jgi:AraC-like DNA-binding protein
MGHDGHVITALHQVRHLVRARDLADRRYLEAMTVVMLAREAGLSPAYFTREFRLKSSHSTRAVFSHEVRAMSSSAQRTPIRQMLSLDFR